MKRHTDVVSPFAGGVLLAHASQLSSAMHVPPILHDDELRLATLNPGRLGLSILSGNDVMY